MSKIAIVLDVLAPKNVTLLQGQVISCKLDCLNSTAEYDMGTNLNASIFPVGDAIMSPYVRMRLAYLRKYRGWKIGMSDDSANQDISLLSAAAQLDLLTRMKTWSESCYVCGDTKPVTDSYLPQVGMNDDTLAALAALRISTVAAPVAAPGIKSVIPTAFSLPEAQAKVEAGVDVVLMLNTDLMSMPTYAWKEDYPVGLKRLISTAKDRGVQFVNVNDF